MSVLTFVFLSEISSAVSVEEIGDWDTFSSCLGLGLGWGNVGNAG